MTRRRSLARCILASLVLAALVLTTVQLTREPSAHGKSLSGWLEEYERIVSAPVVSKEANPPSPAAAIEAIRGMGDPGIGALLKRMQATDSRWKLWFQRAAQKQTWITLRFQPARLRRTTATGVLCDLGPSASSAIPKLTEWLGNKELAEPASRVLVEIGRAAVKPVHKRLANGRDNEQANAARVLGLIGADATHAVPTLISCLSKTNRALRRAAIRSLGRIGSPSGEISACLTRLLNDPNDALDAAFGLVCMGSNSIPLLTRTLTNDLPKVRVAAMGALTFWQESRLGLLRSRRHDKRRRNDGADVMFNSTVLRVSYQQSAGGEGRVLATLLIRNLEDPNPSVRQLSAAMLILFPSEAAESKPALKQCLLDSDPAVRTAAQRSLEQMPDRRTGPLTDP